MATQPQSAERNARALTSASLRYALATLGYAAISLLVFRPALRGPFISDDFLYIAANRHVQSLGWNNLVSILDPWGEVALHSMNWAPVHLIASAVEWSVWGDWTTPYHVVNVLLHGVAAGLLTLLFRERGFSVVAAGFAAAVFLLHPANVEAVAWISQLKTLLALNFTLAALLLHPRRPLLGTAAFALGLLSKASALYALPAAIALTWCLWRPAADESRDAERWRSNRAWLIAWGVLFLLYAGPQFFAFHHAGEVVRPLDADSWVQLRTAVAIGGRYLAMATTSYGIAAYHQPPLVSSPLDPWWIFSLAAGVAIGWRWVVSLRRRNEEAFWWTWAAAAYFPVSQVFAFLYPMGDRYLYFVLPALLGLLLSLIRGPKIGAVVGSRPAIAAVLAILGVTSLAFFGARSYQRAAVWQSETNLFMDSATRYPYGMAGQLMLAQQAAKQGDVNATVLALRGAVARGFDDFTHLGRDPLYQSMQHEPPFFRLREEIARDWIEDARAKPRSLKNRKGVARAHAALGEFNKALAALDEAELIANNDADARTDIARMKERIEGARDQKRQEKRLKKSETRRRNRERSR